MEFYAGIFLTQKIWLYLKCSQNTVHEWQELSTI